MSHRMSSRAVKRKGISFQITVKQPNQSNVLWSDEMSFQKSSDNSDPNQVEEATEALVIDVNDNDIDFVNERSDQNSLCSGVNSLSLSNTSKSIYKKSKIVRRLCYKCRKKGHYAKNCSL